MQLKIRIAGHQEAYPALHSRTTADGMQWVDDKGKPPVFDERGLLKEPFILHLVFGDGSPRGDERWGVGSVLPQTPAAHAKWAAEVEAERRKRHPGRSESETRDEPTPENVSGKRIRKVRGSDADLTEEQKAKRDKRRARREARKKRRG